MSLILYTWYFILTTYVMELNHPIVTLKNWLRVANFSSLHEFAFEDWTVVPWCEEAKTIALSVLKNDTVIETNDMFSTLTVSVDLTEDIEKEITYWIDIWNKKEVDIVMVPSRVIEWLKNKWFDILHSPFRNGKSLSRLDKILKCNEFYIK